MTIQHLINGQSVASATTFETINPATQEVLAEVSAGGADEINAAVQAAKTHSRSGPACPPPNEPSSCASSVN